jgi:hypothetical protein
MYRRRGDDLWRGARWGAVVGLLAGVVLAVVAPSAVDDTRLKLLLLFLTAPAFALLGALFGMFVGASVSEFLPGEQPAQRPPDLDALVRERFGRGQAPAAGGATRPPVDGVGRGGQVQDGGARP